MPPLRPATPSDLSAIVALTEEAYAHYLPVLGYPPVPVTEDYALRVEAGEVWLLEAEDKLAVANSGKAAEEAAGQNGRPVGGPSEASRETNRLAGLMVIETHPDHLMLFSIAVAKAHQGKGLGVAMMQWLEDRARELGKPEIRLYTNALMTRNLALYQSLGYEETGRRPNPKRPQFTIVDMVKRVAP